MLGEEAIRFRAVKIISIDDGERFTDGIGGHKDRVRGAPGFGPARRHGAPCWQFVEFLKDIFHRDSSFKPRAHELLELRGDLLTDNEHKSAKSGAQGIVDRIVNYGFTTRADGINLLQAAVTGAHSGGEDKQSRFHNGFS